jgi:ubiquinone/menaquinone biosynthesis C-methylase UbiE
LKVSAISRKETKTYFDRFAREYGHCPKYTGSKALNQSIRNSFIDTYRGLASQIILEVGCGNGILLKQLENLKKPDVLLVGLDYAFQMVKETGKLFELPSSHLLLQGDGADLPFHSNFFDMAMMCNVTLNIEQTLLENIFFEVFRVLKPNGLFLVEFKNRHNPFVFLRTRLLRGGKTVRDFTKTNFLRTLDGIGFQLIQIKPVWRWLGCWIPGLAAVFFIHSRKPIPLEHYSVR